MIGPETSRLPQATSWSVVRRSVAADLEESHAAVSRLCDAYWYPLYAFFRRSGQPAGESGELTQSFFAHVLGREVLAKAVPERGCLRSYLLSCARRFLQDPPDRQPARRRGALRVGLVFDPLVAEERYAAEPDAAMPAEQLFERRWALAVLGATLQRIEAEFEAQGKAAFFARVRPFLGFGRGPEVRYEQVGAALGMTIGTVKSHVFRLRHRWRELLCEEVANTLDEPSEEEIKVELAALIGCM